MARLRKRSMVPPASAENTAGGEEAAGALVLQENVRQTPVSSDVQKNLIKQYSQENEAFTRQMAAKSRKIVMDAEHGDFAFYQLEMSPEMSPGEAKGAIDRCKKFLNNVETRSRALSLVKSHPFQ